MEIKGTRIISLQIPNEMIRLESTQDFLFRVALEAFQNTSVKEVLDLKYEIPNQFEINEIIGILWSQMSYLECKRSGSGLALFPAEVLKIKTSNELYKVISNLYFLGQCIVMSNKLPGRNQKYLRRRC